MVKHLRWFNIHFLEIGGQRATCPKNFVGEWEQRVFEHILQRLVDRAKDGENSAIDPMGWGDVWVLP